MGWLEEVIKKVMDTLSETVRKFTAYSMVLFFLGTLFGFYIDKIAAFMQVERNILLFVPLVLAVLAYYITEIAILLFLLLLGLVVAVFL